VSGETEGQKRRENGSNGSELTRKEKRMTPIMLKTDLKVVWIKAEAMSRKGKRVLFHGKGDEVGLCFAAGRTGQIKVAYVEFKDERGAIQLEGCVGSGQRADIELQELEQALIMTDIADQYGACVVLSRGFSETKKRELMTDSGCEAWFASTDWGHGGVYTRSPGEEPC
jgi:hypothetical protein